jgi:hypothetical protein
LERYNIDKIKLKGDGNMAFGNAELDKLKGVERVEHALHHSDLDRPKHYFYDHEMSKEAFEKQKNEGTNVVSGRKVVAKAGEVIAFVIAAAVLFTFFKGIFM